MKRTKEDVKNHDATDLNIYYFLKQKSKSYSQKRNFFYFDSLPRQVFIQLMLNSIMLYVSIIGVDGVGEMNKEYESAIKEIDKLVETKKENKNKKHEERWREAYSQIFRKKSL